MKPLKNVFIFLVFIVYWNAALSEETLGCLDDNGQLKDWFAMYKLPMLKSDNQNVADGEGYVFLDSGKWKLSDKSIDDPNTQLMKTLMQVRNRRDEISYLIYNDEDPITGRSGSRNGHTKGILAVDEKTGFWIVHSAPKFPPNPKDFDPSYPDNAKIYGQTFLCITFKQDDLEKILRNFMYTVPYIYARHSGKGVGNLPQDLKKLFLRKSYRSTAKSPWTYTTTIDSLNGEQTFHIFGKHKKWHKDLYDDLVAPNLKCPLFVETWRRGAGGKLQSSCEEKYQVVNIEHVNIKPDSQDNLEFKYTNDHSKWAITEAKCSNYICIGDINRMKSQFRRGGGTVCMKNDPLWKAFSSSIEDSESCQIQ